MSTNLPNMVKNLETSKLMEKGRNVMSEVSDNGKIKSHRANKIEKPPKSKDISETPIVIVRNLI
jgi:hypothetical protein